VKFSIIVPVYKNEESIIRLLDVLNEMNMKMNRELEVVFVVDGSPDRSYEILRDALHSLSFSAQLLAHSRNFGSFPAIRTGLASATGNYFGVMAADLQEPPELFSSMFEGLVSGDYDVVVGTRIGRDDKLSSKISSGIFWWAYRKFVVTDMPKGGIDVFSCNQRFRDELLRLEESHSSLIALIFWLGFRRKIVNYKRIARQEGNSAWTTRRKIDYMADSVFAFTDLPIRMLIRIGAAGITAACVIGIWVTAAHLMGAIQVPGYVPTVLLVIAMGGMNLCGLGIVGSYAWRGYENSKQRPLAVVASHIFTEKT
jgi:glycosyltransferase involved in cell wall biosynthesis